MYKTIKNRVEQLDIISISDQRKAILQPLIDFIQTKVTTSAIINLNFICTHNSRRSHLSQVWAQVLANYFNIKNVFCYSGGTETKALFPSIVETLENIGFKIQKISNEKNPVYSIKFSTYCHPIIGFSKTFDSDFNPRSNFAAIMTCSSADVGCPFISGAEKRIPITFEDPKAYDNTPLQLEKYNERSLEIATQLKYVFSKIQS
jgi:arsenate reductase